VEYKIEPQFSDLQVLIHLGLTLKQAKVYSTVTNSGISSVSTNSRISKVARPDVYRVLLKLNKLGLVEKVIRKPVSYRAIPMEIGLRNLLRLKTDEYRKVKAETQILLDTAKKKEQKSNHVIQNQIEPQFILIPEGKNIIDRIKTAIETAQLSINVVLSWKRFSRGITNDFAESIEKAWSKKVKIRFLIGGEISNTETAKQLIQFCKEKPFCQMRFISGYPETIFGIYDKKEIFVVAKLKTDLHESPGLWSCNDSLIGMARQYFEMLWLTAKESPSALSYM